MVCFSVLWLGIVWCVCVWASERCEILWYALVWCGLVQYSIVCLCVRTSGIVSVKVRDVRFYGVFVCEDKWNCECLSERCDML